MTIRRRDPNGSHFTPIASLLEASLKLGRVPEGVQDSQAQPSSPLAAFTAAPATGSTTPFAVLGLG